MIKLTDEQELICDQILKFDKDEQKLGGYAGTGKTECVRYISDKLPKFANCAFTGKAANVLRKKGVKEAATIHSTIYSPMTDDWGNPILTESGSPIFELKHHIPFDGFLVDEASMISEDIYNDLKSFNKPIVFVGDHGQLEPIGKSVNLMAEPDYRLETIHRNAGEIAYFGQHLRQGLDPRRFETSGAVVLFDKKLASQYYHDVDQIICAYNKTRVKINHEFRALKYDECHALPIPGDRIMCLKNNKEFGLFNGMQGELLKIKGNLIDWETDEFIFEDLSIDMSQFGNEKYDFNENGSELPPFDWCHGITNHKAQGDEFDRVMVIDQPCKRWDHTRWRYVAGTRGKTKCYWGY